MALGTARAEPSRPRRTGGTARHRPHVAAGSTGSRYHPPPTAGHTHAHARAIGRVRGLRGVRRLAGVRVAVTGGAGFIGTHTVEALIATDATVLVIDDMRHASQRRLPAQVEIVEHDVASPAARGALQTFKPEAILHLAAQGGVNRSWREPVEDARCNVMGTVSVLQAAADAACSRVVIASSGGALYGDSPRLPSSEDEPAAPRSPYGAAKLSAEAYLRLFAAGGTLSGCALRYGNVYGPGQDGTSEAGVVAISCRRLLAKLAPEIRG